MFFPWYKYEEVELQRRNTLQIFITNRCDLSCSGCFVKKMKGSQDISVTEYTEVIEKAESKGVKQINIIGGEPLLHPDLPTFVDINNYKMLSTTIYTNGLLLDSCKDVDLYCTKIRIGVHNLQSGYKPITDLPKTDIPFDLCYMIGRDTTKIDLLESVKILEGSYDCNTFFISSIRELDNHSKDFFTDTNLTKPVLHYKELVHEFLQINESKMNIHISKRGVFESTKTLPDNKCRFANYFIGGKIIQCPFDIVNMKFQKDYFFNNSYCKQNNTCLMSKIKLRIIK